MRRQNFPSGFVSVIRQVDADRYEAVADVPTAKGARNPVVDATGRAYVPDSPGGRLIVVEPPPSK